MKVLLFTSFGKCNLSEEMNEIMNKCYFPKNRIGEIIDYIENNNEEILNLNDIFSIKKSIAKFKASSTDKNFMYACFSKDVQEKVFSNNINNLTIFNIVDVDTTRPWRIRSYDGTEYIEYLDYEILDRDMNYCVLKQDVYI